MNCAGKNCTKKMKTPGKTFNLRCKECQRQFFLDLWDGAPVGSDKRDRIACLGKMMKGEE